MLESLKKTEKWNSKFCLSRTTKMEKKKKRLSELLRSSSGDPFVRQLWE